MSEYLENQLNMDIDPAYDNGNPIGEFGSTGELTGGVQKTIGTAGDYGTTDKPGGAGFDFSKLLNNLKSQIGGFGQKATDNPLQALLMLMLAGKALSGGNTPRTAGYKGPGINMNMAATRSPIAPINYKPYSGQPVYGPQSSQVTYAAEGGIMALRNPAEDINYREYSGEGIMGPTGGGVSYSNTPDAKPLVYIPPTAAPSATGAAPAPAAGGSDATGSNTTQGQQSVSPESSRDYRAKMAAKYAPSIGSVTGVSGAQRTVDSEGYILGPNGRMQGSNGQDLRIDPSNSIVYEGNTPIFNLIGGGGGYRLENFVGDTQAKPWWALAKGGLAGYADGGIAAAKGRYLRGPTDGMADLIDTSIDNREPAKLSHGEFVVPADVVSHLGNGNSDAGADVLYKMMDKVRMARTGRKKQGKQINPNKFMPGGAIEDAKYASGGDVKTFADGGTTTESNIASWAGPYVMDYLNKGQALANLPYQSFTDFYGGNVPLTAGQSPLQQQAYQGYQNLGSFPSQYNTATQFATQAGQNAQNMGYTPQNVYAPYLQQYQMTQPSDVSGQAATAATVGQAPQATAQTGTAASAGYAPTYTGQSAQAAQLAPYTGVNAASGYAAQAGAAPTFTGQQFYGPQQVGYQSVGAERVTAPSLQNLYMQAANPVTAQQYSAPTMQGAQTGFQPNLQQYQMGPAQQVSGLPSLTSQNIQAAQTGYTPNIQTYQMGPAQQVATQGFDSSSAQGLMSPYMQNVVDIQQREAQRQADIASTRRGAKFAQAGAFGGARQAIENAEAARNLAMQKGDIQEKGLQQAYQQAQQQFNTQQQQALAAQQANQQAGLTVGQQNLAAQQAAQQLGVQTGLQTSLANLNNQQQAAVQNEANRLQAQGMTAQQALQAALANQQAGLTVGQQNLSAQLGVQQLGTQTGLQAALANLNNQQQAAVQNQAAQLQTQGMNAQQALQVALANQQNQQQANLQNLSAGLQTQGLQAQTGLQAQQLNQATGLQALLANQQAGINTGQFNAQMGYNTALQNAQLAQQAGLANQALAGQYGLANLGNQQQMAMANLSNQQAANLANQQAANQFALTQAGYGQQANMQTAQQLQQQQLANQALQGQYGLSNAQMAQQMGLANLGNLQQTALANQAMQGQYGLTGAGYQQAAAMQNAQLAQQAALANQQMRYNVGQQNLNALLGVQNLGAGQNLQAQLANQQAGQFGANFGLQANQQQLAAAQALAGIGQNQYASQLAGLQGMLGAGTQQQQTEQAGIAALQNEYNKQMMYPYQQLQFQQGLLSGLPVAAATNTPNTSPLSQLYGGAGDLMAFYQKMFGGSKP